MLLHSGPLTAISIRCCTFNSQLLGPSPPSPEGGIIIHILISKMRILRLREVRSHSQEEAKLGRNPELSDPPLDPSPSQVFSTLEFAKVGLATA